MASIQFFVRNRKNPTKIALRMYINRNVQPYATTNILINSHLWSEKKQRLKGGDDYTEWVNATLDELRTFLIQRFSQDFAKGMLIDTNWLRVCVAEFFNRPKEDEKTLFEEFTQFIESNPEVRGKMLSKNTLQNYAQTANIAKSFRSVSPQKVDLRYHKDFIFHLKSQGYAPNTISKHIAILKSFLLKLDSMGVAIHPSVKTKDFFIPPEIEIDAIYLNEERIEIIKNLVLEKEYLIGARDNFILGLWTGLRVSDFLKLHEYNINGVFFEVQTQKTSAKVVIPIHKDVAEILERNGGLPKNLSDQKFNKHIKEICRIAGFTENTYGSKVQVVDGVKRKVAGMYPFCELVTSHICRRSFATNLYGKLPNLTIMQITGHKTEKSFLKYIKTTSKEHAQKLKEYWENQASL